MKSEFNLLKGLLFDSNTYSANGDCNWSEVSALLEKLEDKIDEVEKRMECAIRSAKEITNAICKYSEDVDSQVLIRMHVNDHDSIFNGSNDIKIALDMKDDMCVVDNWYDLFSPKEELKPIAVGNIEYDFPEEVYTIGNANNTEIIGDVYESEFHLLLDLGVIITENSFGSSFGLPFGKANYIVSDNKFISIVKKKQIDLSKVPIIKQEVFMSFESSWGTLTCDKEGYVIEVIGDEEFNGERNYLYDIWQIDLAEYEKFLNSIGQKLDHYEDILSVGYWNKVEGKEHLLKYNEPDTDWRKSMFTPEDDEAPTMLCQDESKNSIVQSVISYLKDIEVDGETMEYILEQVGMKEQMLKQLFAQSTNDEIDYLHDVRNGKG